MLLSFASLRIFMLLPRFRELKLLSESILRALPTVVATILSLMVIWLMFAILGVSLFGGGTSQCAALSTTSGLPGCGVDFGSVVRVGDRCRYAKPCRAARRVSRAYQPSQCGCVGRRQQLRGHRATASAHVGALLPLLRQHRHALLALMQIALDGWAN